MQLERLGRMRDFFLTTNTVWVIRIFRAGYKVKFRHDVVRQVIARYEGMTQEDTDGHQALIWGRDWQRTKKSKQKR